MGEVVLERRGPQRGQEPSTPSAQIFIGYSNEKENSILCIKIRNKYQKKKFLLALLLTLVIFGRGRPLQAAQGTQLLSPCRKESFLGRAESHQLLRNKTSVKSLAIFRTSIATAGRIFGSHRLLCSPRSCLRCRLRRKLINVETSSARLVASLSLS